MPPRAITQVCSQCEMPLVLPVSFIGKTIACSRCGHAVLVSGQGESNAPALPLLPPHVAVGHASPLSPPPPPDVAVPDVRPPHLREASAAAPPKAVAIGETPSGEGDPGQPPRRSCMYSGCMTVVVAALVLSAVVGMAVGASYLLSWDRRSMISVDGMNPGEDGEFNKRKYTDASRKAVTIDGVTVRIDKVQVGKVDFRSKGEILQTATPHYLIVNVNVKNKSRSEPVLYQSWYDQKFEDDQGNSFDVELRDEHGHQWEVFVVPDADKVEQHFKREVSLTTDDETKDSLIFKLPEEYIDEPIPPLYLTLPGAAVGDDGVYRFHLPGGMVERRDK